MNLRSHYQATERLQKPRSPFRVAVAMFTYPILDIQSTTSLENLVIESLSSFIDTSWIPAVKNDRVPSAWI